MILISDASILIDLGFVDGIEVLPKLGTCEVLDLVLMECEHESQPDLVAAIKKSRISVIPVSDALLKEANSLQAKLLSLQDKLTFCYAANTNRIVLAGDRPLRDKCQEAGIEFKGTIWVVEEAHRKGLVQPTELCRWLTLWPSVGRRLPPKELDRLYHLLKCGKVGKG